MNTSILFLSLLLICSMSHALDDISFIKVNLPIVDNTTGLNLTVIDLNQNNTFPNTTYVNLTQQTEADNLAMELTSKTNTAESNTTLENCKVDNIYAKTLSDLDNEISNLRIVFMNNIISQINNEKAFLNNGDPHGLMQQYLLNFEVLQGKLNILKSDVVLHNKAACGKIYFMMFNTENLLNNLYYLLEAQKFELR
jgi:hypothetical protein